MTMTSRFSSSRHYSRTAISCVASSFRVGATSGTQEQRPQQPQPQPRRSSQGSTTLSTLSCARWTSRHAVSSVCRRLLTSASTATCKGSRFVYLVRGVPAPHQRRHQHHRHLCRRRLRRCLRRRRWRTTWRAARRQARRRCRYGTLRSGATGNGLHATAMRRSPRAAPRVRGREREVR